MKSSSKLALAFLACFLSTAAGAATFKCKGADGATLYSDKPCEMAQEPIKIVAQSFGGRAEVSEEIAKQTLRIAANEGQQSAVKGASQAFSKATRGMTEQEVRQAMGAPANVIDNGGFVQWVYYTAPVPSQGRAGRGGSNVTYVYFRNGLVR